MTGVPVGRLLGIEVRLQFGWILVLALVAAMAALQIVEVEPTVDPAIQWLLGGTVAVGFLISAVVHDLSHALMARRRGIEVPSIVISFFGGVTPQDPASAHPGDDLRIAIAGPVASTLLGASLAGAAVALGIGGGPTATVIAQVLAVLGVLNLALGVVNVIPAYPLDGGRIVRAVVWRRTGSERDGWRAAVSSGRIVAGVTVGLGLAVAASGSVTNGAMIALSGWFLLVASRAIRERVKVDDLIGGLAVQDVMERDVPTIQPGLTIDVFAGQLLGPEAATTAVPVLRGDEVVGILGVRDVRRIRSGAWATTRVEALMARPPRLPFLGPEDDLVRAVERLQRSGLDGLPVVQDGRLVGVLTRRSIGKAVQARSGPGRADGAATRPQAPAGDPPDVPTASP